MMEDHFRTGPDGERYAGTHVLADLWACRRADVLTCPLAVEALLRAAVAATRARLLRLVVHHFGDGQGVTGLAVLEESHVSIHTWPEHRLAVCDAFLCGEAGADANAAIVAIARILHPHRIDSRPYRRGRLPA